MSTQIDIDRTLEALYKINKQAKKYATRAEQYYRKNKHPTARRNKFRKRALYELKTEVLEALAEQGIHNRVERHVIDDRSYYCFYFDEWSFHTPVDEWSGPTPSVADTTEVEEFEATAEASHTDMTLKSALLHMQEAFGESANDYLPEPTVRYGNQRHFTGWKYLD